MNKYLERIVNGIFKENPTFIIMLGMCPTLATTTSAMNGLGMGLSTLAVLMFSNLVISALRKVIPERMRLPGEIVVVASLVTIVQLLIQAYVPSIYEALGIYIPLIVVNCIILGRAESYALFNGPLLSFCDGLGMGLGFTFALVIISAVRELIGSGSIFNFQIIPEAYHISIFVLAPGAFLVLAMLTAIQNKLRLPSATNGDAVQSEFVCSGNCMGCFSDCKTEEVNPVAKAAVAKSAAQSVESPAGNAVDEIGKKADTQKAEKKEKEETV